MGFGDDKNWEKDQRDWTVEWTPIMGFLFCEKKRSDRGEDRNEKIAKDANRERKMELLRERWMIGEIKARKWRWGFWDSNNERARNNHLLAMSGYGPWQGTWWRKRGLGLKVAIYYEIDINEMLYL